MVATSSISGVEQLRKRLQALEQKVQNKLERASMTASLRVIAKAIKAEVPSTWKEGRKAIGFSFVRGKGKWKGATFAKAGVGAGIRKKARESRTASKASRKGRKGVGIGVGNFHWFILGTEERTTGSKRVGSHRAGVINRRVSTAGRMKPNPIVKSGSVKAKAAALRAMADSLKAGIEREAAKK